MLVNLLLIFICSDSRAVIAALAKTITAWALDWTAMRLWVDGVKLTSHHPSTTENVGLDY